MIKRFFDVVFSLLGLLILSVPMLFIAIMVRVKIGAPIIFSQRRPGENSKVFTLYKFCSMINLCDVDGHQLPDSERLPLFGKWLRKTSLDELPELWNVLKGDMSLVGPRPLLVEYLPLYSETQARRHEVRPGITGWAQVNGRNSLGWDARFKMDVWYVDNHSLWLDLKILVLTVYRVLQSDGITQDGHATMEHFRGSGR